jgi:hypothetical protein
LSIPSERTVRGLAVGTAILAAVGSTTASHPAYAVDPGAPVGIGLGSLAVGTMLGAAANPYYNNPYYNYGYYYPPAPPTPRPTIPRCRIIRRGRVGTLIIGAITPAEPVSVQPQSGARQENKPSRLLSGGIQPRRPLG